MGDWQAAAASWEPDGFIWPGTTPSAPYVEEGRVFLPRAWPAGARCGGLLRSNARAHGPRGRLCLSRARASCRVSGCQLRDTWLFFSTGLGLGLGTGGVGVRHGCRPGHLSGGQLRTLQEAREQRLLLGAWPRQQRQAAAPAWWPGTTASSMARLELGLGLGPLAEAAAESRSSRKRGRWPGRQGRRIVSGAASRSGRAVCPVGPDRPGPV